MSFDQNNSTFTRVGSFKQMSLTERISDPQDCKPAGNELIILDYLFCRYLLLLFAEFNFQYLAVK